MPVLLFNGCMGKGWEAFIYADKNNWDQIIVIGLFDSLYECRAEAMSKLEEVSSIKAGHFECGYNCSYDAGKELNRICDKNSD
ncbi:hypothetical protein [Marinicella sp. W31]|uniref:hypothetical protein n=1 Tax=Marinicella sp. W31 TaxID=3023713 RepID=UPI003758428A